MSEFITIRQSNLELFPSDASRNTRLCAAALLEYFKYQFRQRKNWFTITIAELRERLLEQFGKDAISKACSLLDELGLVVRRHHRLNPRAWQYKYVATNSATVVETSATVVETSPNIYIYRSNTQDPTLIDPPQGGAEEIFEEGEEVAEQTEEVEEISEERKNEVSRYIGEFPSRDQSSAPEVLGEKMPENLQQKLDKAGIEVDERVREAIASHHLSQSLAAAQHCIDTADSIKSPKSVFLFQISRQPAESLGTRFPVISAADFAQENSAAPEGFWEQCRQILSNSR